MVLSQLARGLAAISLWFRQPLESFCELETAHDTALVTSRGDYMTVLRIDGLQRLATRAELAGIAEALRLDLQGTLEEPGHAIAGWYVSDPEQAVTQIELASMRGCREAARQVGLDLDAIFDERMALWSKLMRWDAAYLVLWTRIGVLNKEERRQMAEEQAALARQGPPVGETQQYWRCSEVMKARHDAFVLRVMTSLRSHGVASALLSPHQAIRLTREMIYRETAGGAWKATLPGDRVMPRCPDNPGEKLKPEHLLWPSIRSQIFGADARTRGGQRVEIGECEYAPVDLAVGPEDPRPFLELSARLGQDRIPWRAAVLLEAGGPTSMALKDVGAAFLWMFPGNNDLRRAFAALRALREEENHNAVRLRASFATWAPVEETKLLRRRASRLTQRVEAWGNCRTSAISGDPLEAALSSVPSLAAIATGAPMLAPLGDALLMLPWAGTASPFIIGSILFRLPHGGLWPYDPADAAKRPLVADIFVAPPGSGKSVLANTINIGLCLSSAVLGSQGAKLPLIGKVDIGPSSKGFVSLIQETIAPDRRHQAIFTAMKFAPGYEVNIFDLQVGCEYPLPLERAFLTNFLSLVTLPPDQTAPFEGMAQLIELVIDEAYRLATEVPGGAPKRYRPGVERLVDDAINRHRIALDPQDPHWRDVVTVLCKCKEYRLAEIAQRHAVPVLQDLINASRTDQIHDAFASLRLASTQEQIFEVFQRYVTDFIRRFPTLNASTRLDFGSARIIALDLQEVAPTGSPAADRQTELMFLLARHILARNFFLHPDHAVHVPPLVRDYHAQRFQEVYETLKRLDYDEWHRAQRSPQVLAQAVRDVREGRKHNVQLGFASQRLSDMSEDLINMSTGRFVLRAGDQAEAEAIITRFNLGEAAATVVRHGLPGPSESGAPFLAIFDAAGVRYEVKLVNSLGSIELWALGTTPGDVALRNRLYRAIGFREALDRLATVFAKGSAMAEIDRRKGERLTRGEGDAQAETGVIDEIAAELLGGTGLGLKLRQRDEPEPVRRAAE